MSPSPPNLALPNYLVLKRKYHLIEEHENWFSNCILFFKTEFISNVKWLLTHLIKDSHNFLKNQHCAWFSHHWSVEDFVKFRNNWTCSLTSFYWHCKNPFLNISVFASFDTAYVNLEFLEAKKNLWNARFSWHKSLKSLPRTYVSHYQNTNKYTEIYTVIM